MKRVVVTGIGVVAPIGIGAKAFWDNLLAGKCGIRRIAQFEPAGFACQIAGEVPAYKIGDFVPKSYRKATKVMARDIELAVIAAALFWAVASAWPQGLAPANRIWFRVGLLLHRVVNPVVMAAVYYVAITPFGLVSQMFRAGLARTRRPERHLSSYWIARGGPPSRMDQQF